MTNWWIVRSITLSSLMLHWPFWRMLSYTNKVVIIVTRSSNKLRLRILRFAKHLERLCGILREQQLWCIRVIRAGPRNVVHFPKSSAAEWDLLLLLIRHIVRARTDHRLWCNLLELPQVLEGHESDVGAPFRFTFGPCGELWWLARSFQRSEDLRVEAHFFKNLIGDRILNRFALSVCNQVTWHGHCAERVRFCVGNLSRRCLVLKWFWTLW